MAQDDVAASRRRSSSPDETLAPTLLDVTTAVDGSASTCSANLSRCSYSQVLTGKEWTRTMATTNDGVNGINYCSSVIGGCNGKSGWHLPSVDKLGVAYNGSTINGTFNAGGSQITFPVANRGTAGIKTLTGTDLLTVPSDSPLWSSTAHSVNFSFQGLWVVNPSGGYVDNVRTNSGYIMFVVCGLSAQLSRLQYCPKFKTVGHYH